MLGACVDWGGKREGTRSAKDFGPAPSHNEVTATESRHKRKKDDIAEVWAPKSCASGAG